MRLSTLPRLRKDFVKVCDTPRQRLYVDTMGFDSASICIAIELWGAEQVLLGSDWPIMPITPRQRVEEVLAPLGLSATQRTAILGGNTLHLLTSRKTSR